MRDSLLWIDMLVRLALGTGLVLGPRIVMIVLGLPRTNDTFWPRIVGATMMALAAALFIEGRYTESHGLGLGGAFIVNMTLAFALATGLVIGRLRLARHGRFLMWLAVVLSTLLGLVELAWI